ncbi:MULTISPECIES: glycosyltransferase family 4 protein [unclassified Cyanobium]|uniref:glycosyltransferase family 4 protein n=1 Tax=unclassified Cyanobium TaxID=2627006 RepID=UPI0020CCF198|nr:MULTISPECIES: glycosyltransferase family 4 protein [unclassified Cyanobium]MCP9776959.1 glycosyltransferase family 4 protein [Cyanobium sp. Tous-M-B4]
MIQLLREWPPGYGGVERVAHELASALTANGDSVTTLSLRAPSSGNEGGSYPSDPLPVNYARLRLPALRMGKLLFVLPSARLWRVLTSDEPLLLHLPCPMVLVLGMAAWLLKPRRKICVYWHAFLDSQRWLVALLLSVYEGLAVYWIRAAQVNLLTTSPVLAEALREEGIDLSKIAVLSCCLSEVQEQLCLQKCKNNQAATHRVAGGRIKLVFVGRLGTYKRVDLLLRAFAGSAAGELHIIGTGDTTEIEVLIAQLVPAYQQVVLHGRLDEQQKLDVVAACDVLILPSYSSNEAFGIVQLEAMACGLAVCAPQILRSGLGWVGSLNLLCNNTDPVQDIRGAIEVLSRPEMLNDLRASSFARYQQLFDRDVWLIALEACRDNLGA